MNESGPPVLLIGVGNAFRSDDAAGLLAVRAARPLLPPGLTVLEQSGEGASLLDCWQGAAAVVLVDAVSSGALPGTLYRIEAHSQPVPAGFFRYSTHAFGLAESVELARVLGCLPPRLVIHGVEGASFVMGQGLSPAVAQALPQFVQRICAEVLALQCEERA